MLVSKTGQYAIQALIYLALQPPESLVHSSLIARSFGVPAPYLAKILQILSKGGLVRSKRGKHGGFSLKDSAESISVMRVLQITEGDSFNKDCVLGLKVCNSETACPMHAKWKPIKEEIISLLNQHNLAMLRDAVSTGNYRIRDVTASFLTQPKFITHTDLELAFKTGFA